MPEIILCGNCGKKKSNRTDPCQECRMMSDIDLFVCEQCRKKYLAAKQFCPVCGYVFKYNPWCAGMALLMWILGADALSASDQLSAENFIILGFGFAIMCFLTSTAIPATFKIRATTSFVYVSMGLLGFILNDWNIYSGIFHMASLSGPAILVACGLFATINDKNLLRAATRQRERQ